MAYDKNPTMEYDPAAPQMSGMEDDRKLSVVTERDNYPQATGAGLDIPETTIVKVTKTSSIFSIIVSGIALFSDGYNAQIIGYMEPFFSVLYKDGISSEIKTRLSNSYLIGEIFGMLTFGMIIDRLGRRTGIVFATLFLVLGIIVATATHGNSQLGLFWVMIIGRGVAGFGAGGEYPVCGTNSCEAADESEYVRKKRGILVAMTTDFAIDLGLSLLALWH
jgi:MFS family permease